MSVDNMQMTNHMQTSANEVKWMWVRAAKLRGWSSVGAHGPGSQRGNTRSSNSNGNSTCSCSTGGSSKHSSNNCNGSNKVWGKHRGYKWMQEDKHAQGGCTNEHEASVGGMNKHEASGGDTNKHEEVWTQQGQYWVVGLHVLCPLSPCPLSPYHCFLNFSLVFKYFYIFLCTCNTVFRSV